MLRKDKLTNLAFIVSGLIFLNLIFLAYQTGVKAFIGDSIGFIVLLAFFYLTYDKWRLSIPVLVVLVLGIIPHNLGVFGFYANSPLGIEWDHITHLTAIFGFSLLFYRLLQPYMDKKFFSAKTWIMLFVVLVASLGVGSIIENLEFFGFLANGFGEGGLAFGAGDALPGQIATTIEEVEAFGGGWFNTMYDLIWNTLGALVGIAVMSAYNFGLSRKKNQPTS